LIVLGKLETQYNRTQAHNVSSAEVEFEMNVALESAKDNPNFKATFGDRMPSVEEFIETAIDMILIL
jgi:hypothetical protein